MLRTLIIAALLLLPIPALAGLVPLPLPFPDLSPFPDESTLVVVDAFGFRVGVSRGLGGATPLVIFTAPDTRTRYVLYVYADRFRGLSSGLFYTSDDCTGTPYFPVDFLPHQLTTQAVVLGGRRVHLPDTSGEPDAIRAHSRLDADSGQCGLGGVPPGDVLVYPVLPPIDLSHFLPPFRLQ